MNTVIEKRYGMKSSAAAGATSRSYTGSRSVQLTSAEVDGRPVVVYVDVPPGANTNVLDLTKVKLAEAAPKAR
jgi:hypothetical protein